VLHTSTKIFVVWKSSRKIFFANTHSEPHGNVLSSVTHVTAAESVQNRASGDSEVLARHAERHNRVPHSSLLLA
jgi:hypothetical protein